MERPQKTYIFNQNLFIFHRRSTAPRLSREADKDSIEMSHRIHRINQEPKNRQQNTIKRRKAKNLLSQSVKRHQERQGAVPTSSAPKAWSKRAATREVNRLGQGSGRTATGPCGDHLRLPLAASKQRSKKGLIPRHQGFEKRKLRRLPRNHLRTLEIDLLLFTFLPSCIYIYITIFKKNHKYENLSYNVSILKNYYITS